MGDSKKQKQYLTGTVHRLHEGVLESHYAGEEAPEWVTNPKVLTSTAPSGDESTGTPDGTPPAGQSDKSESDIKDDLTDLDGKSLKAIAGELGLKQNGSKADLAARIRAKRAESAPAPSAEDAERTALIEKLTARGIEVDESLTDAELQALVEED